MFNEFAKMKEDREDIGCAVTTKQEGIPNNIERETSILIPIEEVREDSGIRFTKKGEGMTTQEISLGITKELCSTWKSDGGEASGREREKEREKDEWNMKKDTTKQGIDMLRYVVNLRGK